MNKINKKKKIAILIILIILIIIGVRIFTKSVASKNQEITVKVKDDEGLLSDETFVTNATKEGENETSLVLPDFANDKKVKKYIIVKKGVSTSKDTANDTTSNDKVETVEMKPGEKVYLTQEEIENSQIELNVEYDTIDIDKQK